MDYIDFLIGGLTVIAIELFIRIRSYITWKRNASRIIGKDDMLLCDDATVFIDANGNLSWWDNGREIQMLK